MVSHHVNAKLQIVGILVRGEGRNDPNDGGGVWEPHILQVKRWMLTCHDYVELTKWVYIYIYIYIVLINLSLGSAHATSKVTEIINTLHDQ